MLADEVLRQEGLDGTQLLLVAHPVRDGFAPAHEVIELVGAAPPPHHAGHVGVAEEIDR
jgi:hypothetical protein